MEWEICISFFKNLKPPTCQDMRTRKAPMKSKTKPLGLAGASSKMSKPTTSTPKKKDPELALSDVEVSENESSCESLEYSSEESDFDPDVSLEFIIF